MATKKIRKVSELTARSLKSIAGKLAKAKPWQRADVLGSAVEHGERWALAWELVRKALVDPALDPTLWPLLAQRDPIPAAEVLPWIVRLQPAGPEHAPARQLVPGWSEAMDDLVMKAYHADPDAWDAADAGLPDSVRPGLATVRARFGRLTSANTPPAMLDRLALAYLSCFPSIPASPLPPRVASFVRGRALAGTELFDKDNRPTDAWRELVACFGDEDAWKAALVRAVKTAKKLFAPLAMDTLAGLAASELVELLPRLEPMESIFELLARRDDASADLVLLATRCAGEAGELATLHALRVLGARGEDLPESLDARVSLERLKPPPFARGPLEDGQILAALAALPVPRRRAVLERALAAPVEPLLAGLVTLPEPALLARAAAMIDERARRGYAYDAALARGLGNLGEAGLAWLPGRIEDPATPPGAVLVYRVALYLVMGELLRAGREVPAALDRLISFQGFADPKLGDYYYAQYALWPLDQLLALLPAARAEAVFVREIDPAQPYFLRPFSALAGQRTPGALAHAFAVLGAHADKAVDESTPHLSRLKPHADEVRPHALAALRRSGASPAFVRQLGRIFSEDALAALLAEAGAPAEAAREESLSEKVARLAAKLPGERTRVYLLAAGDGPPTAGAIARVDGAPVGVDAASWPRESKRKDAERLTHLVTLDLAEMPELAARLPGTRALALFIRGRGENEAWTPDNTWTKVVRLDGAAVELGVCADDDETPADQGEARALVVTPVDLPVAVFDADVEGDAVEELRRVVDAAPGRAGGRPVWVQGDEHPAERFLFQFDESLVDVNLGDMGVMYVFEDTAFWQCH